MQQKLVAKEAELTRTHEASHACRRMSSSILCRCSALIYSLHSLYHPHLSTSNRPQRYGPGSVHRIRVDPCRHRYAWATRCGPSRQRKRPSRDRRQGHAHCSAASSFCTVEHVVSYGSHTQPPLHSSKACDSHTRHAHPRIRALGNTLQRCQ